MKQTQSGKDYLKLLKYVQEDITRVKAKKISPEKLLILGYDFTKRSLELYVGDTNKVEFFIAEMADEDSAEPASFCYLYNVGANEGFALPNSYEHYLSYLLFV